MIGRQFGALPSQPPNWILIDPSSLGFAVMLLNEYASYSFCSKYPF
jgi:hypothetical protein